VIGWRANVRRIIHKEKEEFKKSLASVLIIVTFLERRNRN